MVNLNELISKGELVRLMGLPNNILGDDLKKALDLMTEHDFHGAWWSIQHEPYNHFELADGFMEARERGLAATVRSHIFPLAPGEIEMLLDYGAHAVEVPLITKQEEVIEAWDHFWFRNFAIDGDVKKPTEDIPSEYSADFPNLYVPVDGKWEPSGRRSWKGNRSALKPNNTVQSRDVRYWNGPNTHRTIFTFYSF